MEKDRRPKSSLASHRRQRFQPLDMSKSSSSLNVSTSSLRSTAEKKTRKDEAAAVVQVSRRTTTTVRFAPPSKSSLVAASSRTTSSSSMVSAGQQAMAARPATASGPRPGSSAGTRSAGPSSAGRHSEAGPKAMRRSWGLAGAMGHASKEERRNDLSAQEMQQVRSSSDPRRTLPVPEENEKPSPKRGNKITITNCRTQNPESESTTKLEKTGSRSSPNILKKTGDPKKAPNTESLNNLNKTMKQVSPPSRITAAVIGASWDSLPSDVQSLGLEVMRYRDSAEAAAVQALQEASAAEILLRFLSAFADLTSTAAEQSPQETVDEFLALQSVLTISTSAAAPRDNGTAGEWLRAAVATDLAAFSLCSAAASQSPLTPRRAAGERGGAAETPATWVDAARGALAEETRAWFLGHVDRLLDGDVPGTLGQLKRVSEWLDAERQSSSSEAVERVRRKIYRFLLDHVESAVVALNGGAGAAPSRRK